MEKDCVQINFNRHNSAWRQVPKEEPIKRRSFRDALGEPESKCMKQQEAESASQRQLKLELEETMTLKRRRRQLIDEECNLKRCLDELQKQLVLLMKSTPLVPEALKIKYPIDSKCILRQLSKLYQDQIKVCIRILKHISNFATYPESLCQLLNKNKEQLLVEISNYERIGRMSESEAKSNLERCELEWLVMQQRRVDIELLVEKEQQNLSFSLHGNNLRQQVVEELSFDYGEVDQLGYVELPAGQLELELEQICATFSKLSLDDTKREAWNKQHI